MLPILHLNGYKIANPTVLARIPEGELVSMLEGFGYTVHLVAGDDPADVHLRLAATLDAALDEIAAIQRVARDGPSRATNERPRWPMIVLRTPKGWTGPESVDGKPMEGSWRSHQVPMSDVRENPAHLSSSRTGCAATDRKSCSTMPVHSGPSWRPLRRRASDE